MAMLIYAICYRAASPPFPGSQLVGTIFAAGLALPQAVIAAFALEQFGVRSLLFHPAVMHDYNPVQPGHGT